MDTGKSLSKTRKEGNKMEGWTQKRIGNLFVLKAGANQGAKYFSYNGKVLDEIRKEIEKK